jgi:predicted metalloprotease
MRWDQEHESPDVVDRRGEKQAGGGGLGGLLFFLPYLLRSKFGWVILLVGGAYYAWTRFSGGSETAPTTSAPAQGVAHTGTKAEEELAHFVSFVLDDTQELWTREFAARGKSYRHAKLVLFTNRTQTGCGTGGAATGPFYCPTDERVYIDLGFYRELEQRLGARGDFAQAYVIAHELGHHVQKLLGTSDKVQALHGKTEGATGASVRVELQADCYAGIWAHSTAQRSLLESGDIDEALGATAAIGDDRLQRQSTGTVSPETWTHGSSEERSRWFRRGYDSGKMEACDTFSAGAL